MDGGTGGGEVWHREWDFFSNWLVSDSHAEESFKGQEQVWYRAGGAEHWKKVIQVEVAGFSPPQDQMGRKKAQIPLTVEIRKQF